MFRNIERIFFVIVGLIIASIFSGIFGDSPEAESKQSISKKPAVGKIVIEDSSIEAWKPTTKKLEAGEYTVVKDSDSDKLLLSNGYYVDKKNASITYIPNKKPAANLSLTKGDVREYVLFNEIPSVTRYYLNDNWQSTSVYKIILTEGSGEILDHKYVGKSVYRIVYETKLEKSPTYTVYVAMDSYKIIGYKNKIN